MRYFLSSSYQVLVHSHTLPLISHAPTGLVPCGKVHTAVVPPNPEPVASLSQVLAAVLSKPSPHGYSRPSVPREARSHSPSSGKRITYPSGTATIFLAIQLQYASASKKHTPTTGTIGLLNSMLCQ